MKNKDLFKTLEQLAQKIGYRNSLIICFDEEDGFWLAEMEKEDNPNFFVGPTQRTLLDALLAYLNQYDLCKYLHNDPEVDPIGLLEEWVQNDDLWQDVALSYQNESWRIIASKKGYGRVDFVKDDYSGTRRDCLVEAITVAARHKTESI